MKLEKGLGELLSRAVTLRSLGQHTQAVEAAMILS